MHMKTESKRFYIKLLGQWFPKCGSRPKQGTWVVKKMGCTEAIQTWVIYRQR